ncbi:MAG: TRAP transporter small permease subunit [Eubacteriales bacterium]|nr:TRAP transporter small permease subunit [Eubacteriales bacterium]
MKRFYDAVYWLFMSFCKFVFIASICITTYVVFCRYALHSTPRWGEQAILLCMVYMALISASLAVRTDTHIRVMLIDYLLPKMMIDFLKGMSHVMIFAFSVFMIVYGFQFTALMSKSVMSGLGCKQSFLYASVPIAGICMLLMQSEKMILFFLRRMDKVPAAYLNEGGKIDG